ncbi:hypothetical protein RKLH11_3388 [Rhodobacteraceae bacterium KLH11]|nr:hypothetical protein RKLH11_3388 [Rhodobacteraceae bacterium KLH11]
MIHITCANLSKPNNGDGEPVAEDTVRLALPIGGFTQSLQQMHNMLTLLKERGVLTEAKPAAEEKAAEA